MFEKRITKEISEIIEKYGNISIIKEKGKYTISINTIGKTITIHINSHYPFRSPHILINNNEYHSMLCIKDAFVTENLQSIYNIDCLCCKSLICPNIWSASCKIIDIVEEIRKNSKIIKKIYCMKFTYLLCRSYGINCLEIPELICKNYT